MIQLPRRPLEYAPLIAEYYRTHGRLPRYAPAEDDSTEEERTLGRVRKYLVRYKPNVLRDLGIPLDKPGPHERPIVANARHGTRAGYRCGCRCDECMQKMRATRAEWRAKRSRPDEISPGDGYSDPVVAYRVLLAAGQAIDVRLSEIIEPGSRREVVAAKRAAAAALIEVMGWPVRHAARLVGFPPGTYNTEPSHYKAVELTRAASEPARQEAARCLERQREEKEQSIRKRLHHLIDTACDLHGITRRDFLAIRNRTAADIRAAVFIQLEGEGWTHEQIADGLGMWRSSVARLIASYRKRRAQPPTTTTWEAPRMICIPRCEAKIM